MRGRELMKEVERRRSSVVITALVYASRCALRGVCTGWQRPITSAVRVSFPFLSHADPRKVSRLSLASIIFVLLCLKTLRLSARRISPFPARGSWLLPYHSTHPGRLSEW